MPKMNQVYGLGQALIQTLPPPIPFETAPTSNQTNYEIGQVVYTPPNAPTAFYMYGGGGNWAQFASSSGDIIAINGTANQVTVTTTSGTSTVSLPSAITTPGSLGTTTTLTGGTGITATTGNIVATTGNITSTAGSVSAGTSVSATTTVTGGTGVTATTGAVTATAGQLIAGGDTGGVASTVSITNSNSTTISTGTGTVKMSSANNANNAAWVKIYVGATAYWIPAWTTNAP